MRTYNVAIGFVGKNESYIQKTEYMINNAINDDDAIAKTEDLLLDYRYRNNSKAKRLYASCYLIIDGVLMDLIKTKFNDLY